MSRRWIALISVCWLLASMAVAAGVEPFVQAITQALAHNPEIKAAEANWLAAQERLPQSRAALLPNLALNVTPNQNHSRWRGGSSTESSLATGVTLTQMVYNRSALIAFDQTAPFIGAYGDELESAVQGVFLKVAKAVVGLLQAREIAQLAGNNLQVMQRHLTATQSRHRVGEITRTDVSQAEARLASAQADKSRAENNVAVARAQFFEVVGISAAETLALPPFRQAIGDKPLESWLSQLEQRADMRAASKRLVLAESAIAQERAGHWPTVALTSSVNHTWQRGDVEELEQFKVGMKMELPIFSGGMTQSKTAEAQAKRDGQLAQLDRLRRQAYREIEQAFLELKSSQALTSSFESTVAASRMARDGVAREYQVGQRTSLDLLDAEHELFSNQTELAKNRYGLVLAQFQMLWSVGRLTLEELVIQ
ncbi:MAG: TolC family outer membrane protein [Magnetococcales bacterium]|nr:TolC family outer membrane protein [Magnetococcales bacterium]